MHTTELRDPQNANSLDKLVDILNDWAKAIADDDDLVDDYPSDLTSLPTFGVPDVVDTSEVWSWDDDRLLVSGPQITVEVSGWSIEPRCQVCGEAKFHCNHEDYDIIPKIPVKMGV